MGKVLTFKDNKDTAIDLFTEWKYLGSHHQVSGIGPLKLGHIAFHCPDVKAVADFYAKVMGFKVSDWIDDWFVFMRCNTDHHTVNFIKGDKAELHHIAFELKDMSHMQNACEMFATKNIRILWGPLRHGPGHNVATYHRNPDEHTVELYIELDQMKDEVLGYFDPRPWHRDTPQYPKTWKRTEFDDLGPAAAAGLSPRLRCAGGRGSRSRPSRPLQVGKGAADAHHPSKLTMQRHAHQRIAASVQYEDGERPKRAQ